MQLSYYLMTSRAYIQQWPCAVARQWVAWYPDNDPLRQSVRQADAKSSGRDKPSLRSSTEPRPEVCSPGILFCGYWGSFHRG